MHSIYEDYDGHWKCLVQKSCCYWNITLMSRKCNVFIIIYNRLYNNYWSFWFFDNYKIIFTRLCLNFFLIFIIFKLYFIFCYSLQHNILEGQYERHLLEVTLKSLINNISISLHLLVDNFICAYLVNSIGILEKHQFSLHEELVGKTIIGTRSGNLTQWSNEEYLPRGSSYNSGFPDTFAYPSAQWPLVHANHKIFNTAIR